MRSRSRSKHVRHGSGTSSVARSPAPLARVARVDIESFSISSRRPRSTTDCVPVPAHESAWAEGDFAVGVSVHGRCPALGAFSQIGHPTSVPRTPGRPMWHRQIASRGPMSGFVDEAQLNVRGGDGGAGCSSFRREGPVAFGGPNGGDGGKGGDVWLVADRNVASLLAFRDHPHRRAKDGVHGKGKDQHGKRGESLEIMVPEGTVASDLYTGELLADLANHGDRWLCRRRRARRARQRQVLVEQAAGADVRRAGRTRPGAVAEARAEADGRRRPGRASPTSARAR